ncbi:MAG: arylsulfatase [Planctomycetota bacterium]
MPRENPNFVVIMTDQQRGDCLGIEDRKGLMTPYLDHLAASGARFTHAYSPAPTCIAARRTIMSGQEPATHGLVGFRDHLEWNVNHTLPGEFKAAGYQTVLIGHMHLYPRRKRFGFDHMVTAADHRRWVAEHYPAWKGDLRSHGLGDCDRTARPWHLPEWTHNTNWLVEQAMRFLDDRDPSCPFLLVVSFDAPHPPLTPPAFYLERYLSMDLGEPVAGDWVPPAPESAGLHPEAWNVTLQGEVLRYAFAGYYGLIHHIDDQIARLLWRLQTEIGDTYILFTSDHGEMLGDHHMWRKRVPYEGSARVPLLLAGPDIPRLVCSSPVGLQDIMPTFLDLAGLSIPDTVDGRSVRPLLEGDDSDWREYLHGEHAETPSMADPAGMHFLTDGREKYVWMVSTGQEQLFDLVADAQERSDLAPDPHHADRLERWRRRLARKLEGRPEGFSDGKTLIPARPYNAVLSRAQCAGRR